MYLGIDLGTSGLKALIIDDAHNVIATTNQPLAISRPKSGWSEQNPADWIVAAENALDDLKARQPAAMSALRGVGLSGQMHGATLMDADDQVLRPCILWNDSRSAAEAARLDADPKFRAVTGNITFPGFTAPKLLWVAEHEPEIARRVESVLLPKDYLRFWMTGERAMDYCDASGTGWLDTAARQWSEELVVASGASPSMLPRLVESTEVSGRLRDELADRWGLMRGLPVAGGAGDSAASAVGVGAVRDEDSFVSLGTSGVLLVSKDDFRPMPESAVHSFCHATPGGWIQIGVVLSAASTLSWLARLLGKTPAQLIGELGDTPHAPGEVLFLPYLSGERTPHNDADIRGAFLGLGHETDAKAMTQAVLEGVAFAFRDNLDAMRLTGSSPKRVVAVGGGVRAPYWRSAISTALGLPVDAPGDAEVGAALGAARMGMVAASGCDWPEAFRAPTIEQTVEPRADLADAYAEAQARYRAAYNQLRRR